jgi:hypothetical protein
VTFRLPCLIFAKLCGRLAMLPPTASHSQAMPVSMMQSRRRPPAAVRTTAAPARAAALHVFARAGYRRMNSGHCPLTWLQVALTVGRTMGWFPAEGRRCRFK